MDDQVSGPSWDAGCCGPGAMYPQHPARLIDEVADDDAVFLPDARTPMIWAPASANRRTLPDRLLLRAAYAGNGRKLIDLAGPHALQLL